MQDLLIVPTREVKILAKDFVMLWKGVAPIQEIIGRKEFQVYEFLKDYTI